MAEARRADLVRLPQHDRPVRDEDVLVVVRIEGIGDEYLDRADGISVKPIHQHRIEHRALENDVRLPKPKPESRARPGPLRTRECTMMCFVA